MKADKLGGDKNELIELSGKVIQKKFAAGSKSEHDAFYLETEKDCYHLRRLGGNPFADTRLKDLLGKKVIAKGLLNKTLFIAHWIELAE
jgi:hypothetical protein